jgi:superoxide reductase
MKEFGELFQTADWKSEKHVPAIECPDKVTADEMFPVKAGLGKEVAHPNTTAHHIRWIALYFLPDGGKFPFEVARMEFNAHGESPEGPDTSTVYTHHEITATMKTGKAGTLYAAAYCNIHGLWWGEKNISLA